MIFTKQTTLKDIENALKNHVNGRNFDGSLNDYMKAVIPAFGFNLNGKDYKLSIQASSGHYCRPRENTDVYTHVEVGFPPFLFSSNFIEKYAEDKKHPLDTVYGYVPIEVLAEELYNMIS